MSTLLCRAVSGNLTALAYVLSSRFAHAFSKVAAHMRAYYLMVGPAEEPQEQAAPAVQSEVASDDASSSDSSDEEGAPAVQPCRSSRAQLPSERPSQQSTGPARTSPAQGAIPGQQTAQPGSFDDGSTASAAARTNGHAAAQISDREVGTTGPSQGGHPERPAAAAGRGEEPGRTYEQPREYAGSSSSKASQQQESEGKTQGWQHRPEARQHPLWLTFKHGALEQAFTDWQASQQAKVGLVCLIQ